MKKALIMLGIAVLFGGCAAPMQEARFDEHGPFLASKFSTQSTQPK